MKIDRTAERSMITVLIGNPIDSPCCSQSLFTAYHQSIFPNVAMYKPWQSLKRMNIGGLRVIAGQKWKKMKCTRWQCVFAKDRGISTPHCVDVLLERGHVHRVNIQEHYVMHLQLDLQPCLTTLIISSQYHWLKIPERSLDRNTKAYFIKSSIHWLQ